MADDIQPGEYADVMPDMADDEFEALKRSIERDGLRHPIEVTPDGMIVDGHHRYRACQDLGVDPEVTVVDDATVEQAIRANFTRRDHSDGTKREVVEAYLRDHWDGDTTQKAVADRLGVSEPTVSRAMEKVSVKGFSTDEKRQQVADYLDRNPDASNREVARSVEADVSHATVGNWRGEWEAPEDGGEEQDPDPEPDAASDDDERPEESAEEPDESEDDADTTDDADADETPFSPANDPPDEEAEAEDARIVELEGMVEERNALLRDLIRAVENQDPEAIQTVADRAEGLV